MSVASMSAPPALAIDIGGTKLAAGLVEPGGRTVSTVQRPTPHGSDLTAQALWRTVEALVDEITSMVGPAGLAGVGVGCGGPMTWPEGEVSPLNIPVWRDFPLGARLRERFPGLTVRLHNDAVCMAVGEHWRGAGRGRTNMLGVVVSTGVGGGLVLDGQLVNGPSGNAGHVGHIVADPDGPRCSCGGYGCVEAIARGSALTAWAQEQGWRPDRNGDVSARELAADASRGHPVATAALRRAGHAVGVAVASATVLCDLEVVSIGGGLSQAGRLLFDPIHESLRRHVGLSYAREVTVVPAALGQDAGVMGAAALVLAGDRYWPAGERTRRSRS